MVNSQVVRFYNFEHYIVKNIYAIFNELCMKGNNNLLSTSKGNNSCKNTILEPKSEMCKLPIYYMIFIDSLRLASFYLHLPYLYIDKN